jgi:hypothetical protein
VLLEVCTQRLLRHALHHVPKHVSGRRVPSVFESNLQCQPVRGWNTREECHWPHACSLQASRRGNQWHLRIRRIRRKTHKVIMFENAHRTETVRLVERATESSKPEPPTPPRKQGGAALHLCAW